MYSMFLKRTMQVCQNFSSFINLVNGEEVTDAKFEKFTFYV